jgi:hypothetical protein
MKKIEYLPSSLSAVDQLRVDVDAMSIKYYTLPEAPTGVFKPKYAEKCYTFVGGISGNGSEDYLIYMALRPDWEKTGDGKVLDIDTAAFCFKTDDQKAAPSGVALFHQKFDGRTTSLTGYEAFTLEATVNDLHSKLIAESKPLSGAPEIIINAMTHSIKQLKLLLEPQIIEWKVSLEQPQESAHRQIHGPVQDGTEDDNTPSHIK